VEVPKETSVYFAVVRRAVGRVSSRNLRAPERENSCREKDDTERSWGLGKLL